MKYNLKEVFTNSDNISWGQQLILWTNACARIIEFVLSIVAIGLCCGSFIYYSPTVVIFGTICAISSLLGAILGFLSNFIWLLSHPLLQLIPDVLISISNYLGGILAAVYFNAYCTVALEEVRLNDRLYSRTKSGCRIGKALATFLILLGICYNISTLISGIRVYKNGPFTPKNLKKRKNLDINHDLEASTEHT